MLYTIDGKNINLVYDVNGKTATAHDVNGNILPTGEGLFFGNLPVPLSVKAAVDESISKQEYIGGYIEIQPDSWDGSTPSTDATSNCWGFPMSISADGQEAMKSEMFNGNGKGIMYIRFPPKNAIRSGNTAYIRKVGKRSPLSPFGTEKYIPSPSQIKKANTTTVITKVVTIFFVFGASSGFSNFIFFFLLPIFLIFPVSKEILGSGTEARYILTVRIESKRRKNERKQRIGDHSRRHILSLQIEHEEGKNGIESRSAKGHGGNYPYYKQHRHKTNEEGTENHPVEHEHRSEGRCDALSAFELKIEGENMTHHHEKRCDVAHIEGQLKAFHSFSREGDSEGAFKKVPAEGICRRLSSEGAEHIRHSGVSAAVISYIPQLMIFRDNYCHIEASYEVGSQRYHGADENNRA